MELTTIQAPSNNLFRTNGDGLFNASSLAREYGKDVYGYTRNKKIKDLINDVSLEYGYDPELEFTDQGNIVRVISNGTWMHFDIFIKFLGWLDSKLERDFIKSAFAANKKQYADPLQEKLAILEAEITSLKKKLARNAFYKDLQQKEKEAKQLQKEIEKGQKSMRKRLSECAQNAVLSLD
jgi:KilA-N domain.